MTAHGNSISIILLKLLFVLFLGFFSLGISINVLNCFEPLVAHLALMGTGPDLVIVMGTVEALVALQVSLVVTREELLLTSSLHLG